MSDRSCRNRRSAFAFGVTLLVWAVLALESGRPADGVMHADFGASVLIPLIISALGNLFGWKRGKVDSSTLSALESLRGSMVEQGTSLLAGIVDVAGKLAAMTGTFMRFIQKVFGKLYDLLAKVVQRITRILDRVFGPIIDFLNKLRAHLQKFYDKVLKPIVDTIEMVRSFLRLLSFFGVDWAKKLDAKLAEIEHYVLKPYEYLVDRFNEVMNFLNRIVTLDGLLQRVVLLNSLLRDAGAATNLVFNSAMKYRGSGLIPRAPGELKETKPETYIKDLQMHFETGDANYSPVIRETIANVSLLLQRTVP